VRHGLIAIFAPPPLAHIPINHIYIYIYIYILLEERGGVEGRICSCERRRGLSHTFRSTPIVKAGAPSPKERARDQHHSRSDKVLSAIGHCYRIRPRLLREGDAVREMLQTKGIDMRGARGAISGSGSTGMCNE